MFDKIISKFKDRPYEFLFPFTTIILVGLVIFLIHGDLSTKKLKVNSSAYYPLTSTSVQSTKKSEWSKMLEPNMRIMAVSKDLRSEGLENGTLVLVRGLKGKYIVVGELEESPEKTIEIYMKDRPAKAKEWGNKQVNIRF